MARKKKSATVPLETIWEIPDAAWEKMEIIIEAHYPPKPTGRPRADLRKVVNGIIFRLRTGCQWNQLPKIFGDDSTVHRWFQRWAEDGVFEELWAVLLSECEELGGVNWEWQSADGCSGKARLGGVKLTETQRIGASREPRKAFSSRRTVALSA